MKKIVSITFILCLLTLQNIEARAQDFPDFEAELKALEKNQLQTEELQMRNVDAVTDVITDDVSTGQAGVLKQSRADTDTDETIMMTKEQKARARRIRSRPL